MLLIRASTGHVDLGSTQAVPPTERDLDELIKRAVQMDVFTGKPNHHYHDFKSFDRDHFKNLNISTLYNLINQHKRNILRGNKAR